MKSARGSESKANPSQHPKALTKLKERSEFAPNPAAAPRVQRAKLIRAQRPRGVDEARGMRQQISERCPGECS